MKIKTIFREMEINKQIFLGRLTTSLKEEGFTLTQKEVEKIYTVATQLFHRLWWHNSKNRGRRYEKSRQGETYIELLDHYKNLKNFPPCIKAVYQDLKLKMIEKCFENCKILGINSDNLLYENTSLLQEDLLKRYPQVERMVVRIIEVKRISSFSARLKKYKLKKESIQLIIIPLIWENLIREFKNNHKKFISFN